MIFQRKCLDAKFKPLRVAEGHYSATQITMLLKARKRQLYRFQSILAVKEFLISLSLLSMLVVLAYLERRLKGNHKGHWTKLLVSETKDFVLIYHSNKGQFELGFHFREWNTLGFPQHNCQL